MRTHLDPQERDQLVNRDPRNGDRIFPYIGGQEVNTSPTQDFDRYIINFGTMPLEDARAWPDLVQIVEERVKPERDRHEHNAIAMRQKKLWWLFRSDVPELRAATASMSRCLVASIVSKHLIFSFQPTTRVFSNKLYVFAFDHYTPFAILQSRVHVPWAWLLSSTLAERLNYSASDCFETFPFPRPDPRSVIPELEVIGEKLYEARARFMVETNQGLTKTYNALKDSASDDPRVLELRALHEEMDRAVLAAYGWSNIPVPPYCPANDEARAAGQAFEDEVIDRLFALNAEQAAEEKRAQEAAAPAKPARKTAARKSAGTGKKGRGPAKGASGVLPGFEEEGGE